MAEWSAVVNTTATRYLKGASDSTIRERIVFAMLNKRKRIMYNWDGKEVTQQIKFSLPETEAYSGGVLDFEPSDKHRQITLPWRGYAATDTMTEKERLMNKGVPRLVNRYANTMRDMRQSMDDQFGTEIFVDGNASSDRMHGLESFMGTGTNVAADICGEPSDTYGGLSTAPAAVAGTWTSDLSTYPNANLAKDWPSGSGDPEYDYISPRLYNWSSNNWGTGAQTWLDNCERVIRKAIILGNLTHGRRGKPDLCLLADDMYYDYLNKQEAKQTIIVPHKEVQDLGFEGAKQEGVSIMTEFGMTANVGYLLNIDKMHMRCLTKQLFVPKGPEYDIRSFSWLFAMAWFGNMYFEPKFFSKFQNYAS